MIQKYVQAMLDDFEKDVVKYRKEDMVNMWVALTEYSESSPNGGLCSQIFDRATLMIIDYVFVKDEIRRNLHNEIYPFNQYGKHYAEETNYMLNPARKNFVLGAIKILEEKVAA